MRKAFNFLLFFSCSLFLGCNTQSELYLIRESGKWGYINKEGRIIIQPVYENCCIQRQEDSCCSRIIWPGQLGIVKLRNHYGAINASGCLKIQLKFDFLDHYHNSLIIAKSGNKFGVLNLEGDTVFSFVFDNQFVACNGKLGHGQIDGKLYLLDFEKQKTICTDFDKISYFSEGLAAVQKNGLFGYINESGRLVIDAKFQEVWPFNSGLAAVKTNYQWGFIDTSGKFVIPPQYDEAQGFDSFTGKYAVVVKNWKYGLIDRSGNYIIKPKYQFLFYEDKNVLSAKIVSERGEQSGLIDLNERWLTKNIEGGFDYFEGYIKVFKNEGYGLYKLKNNKTIVPFIFEDIAFRSSGLTMLVYRDKNTNNQFFAYVNKKGKLIWKEKGFVDY